MDPIKDSIIPFRKEISSFETTVKSHEAVATKVLMIIDNAIAIINGANREQTERFESLVSEHKTQVEKLNTQISEHEAQVEKLNAQAEKWNARIETLTYDLNCSPAMQIAKDMGIILQK